MDRQLFIETLSEALGRSASEIDLSKSFVENGGYSLAAVRWIDRIGSVTPIVLNFLDVMGSNMLLALLDASGPEPAPAAPGAHAAQVSGDDAEEGVL